MMEFLSSELAGNTLLAWTMAALTVIGGPFVLRLLKRILGKRLGEWSRRTTNRVDDRVYEIVQRIHPLTLFLVPLAVATLVVALPGSWGAGIRNVVVVALLIQAGILASHLVASGVTHLLTRQADAGSDGGEARPSPDPATLVLARATSRVAVWSIVVLLCLDNLGIDITALVAGLGIGGIAVALAVQNILTDLFASFSILVDKPFVVGDYIVIGEFQGTVQRIGVKTTRLQSLSGEQLIFSNADLLQSRIRNYERMQERRVSFALGVVHRTPTELLERIPLVLRELVGDVPSARFERAHFKSFGPYSLDFEVVYFVLSSNNTLYMDTQQAINLAILRAFAQLEIELALPMQTVLLASGRATAPEG